MGPTKRFYFAGDTGFCDEFRKIKKIFGQIDLATLPIGCYSPRSFSQYIEIIILNNKLFKFATKFINFVLLSVEQEIFIGININ